MILASLVERFAPHRRILLPLLLIRSTLIQVALEVAEEVRDGVRCPGFCVKRQPVPFRNTAATSGNHGGSPARRLNGHDHRALLEETFLGSLCQRLAGD